MAIAVDGSTPARWSGAFGSGGNTTSGAFTAPADALLVVCVSADGNDDSFYGTPAVADSGGLIWTEQVRRSWSESTTGGGAMIWTARTTSAVSRTVNTSRSGGGGTFRASVKCYVLTGVDVDGTPVDTVSASNEGGSTSDSISTTSITPGADGLLVVCDCDWAEKGAETSSDLTVDSADYATEISVMSGYKACTSGAGVTGNIDGGGSSGPWQHKWCQVVVRAAAGGGARRWILGSH